MTQAHNLRIRRHRRGEAHDAHRVGVVQYPGVGAERFDVFQDVEENGHCPQGLEQSARADRIADALIHTIPGRYIVVEANAVDTADLDAVDDVVEVLLLTVVELLLEVLDAVLEVVLTVDVVVVETPVNRTRIPTQ